MSSSGPGSAGLSGRVVIVTGGAGLLGREYGRALAAAGAHVILADIDRAGAEHAAGALSADGATVLGIGTDVADEASVADLVRAVRDRWGRIDGLVNNAALDPRVDARGTVVDSAAVEDFPLTLWNRTLAVNLTGSFLCARAVAPTMRAQGRGVIVNVSSTYGVVGPDQRIYESDDPDAAPQYKPVAYSVSKAGIIGLTTYLAAYWAGTGIRVNTLTPGGAFNNQPEAFVRRYSARTPLGRMADRREFCGALLFLLSDASSYMTGSNLIVDGGWTAW